MRCRREPQQRVIVEGVAVRQSRDAESTATNFNFTATTFTATTATTATAAITATITAATSDARINAFVDGVSVIGGGNGKEPNEFRRHDAVARRHVEQFQRM